MDRLSFYIELTATYTQCMGHGTTPENYAGSGDVLGYEVLRLGMMCWQSVTGWQMLVITIGSIMVS